MSDETLDDKWEAVMLSRKVTDALGGTHNIVQVRCYPQLRGDATYFRAKHFATASKWAIVRVVRVEHHEDAIWLYTPDGTHIAVDSSTARHYYRIWDPDRVDVSALS